MTAAIPKPEWKVQAGIYSFSWNGEIQVRAVLDRIKSDNDDIHGELRLYHKTIQGESILEQTKLNLLSDVGRNKLAKSLSERNNEIDWLSILKYITLLTVEHYRMGEPIQFLGGVPQKLTSEYTLYPILEDKEPTTIYADGGTGKSYVADYIAVLVHYNINGFKINKDEHLVAQHSPVLYLDWESTQQDHERRVWAIKQGLNCKFDEKDYFFYRRCTQSLADDIQEIQRIVVDKNIGFVIVDSQVAASDGDQDKADGARRYYNALRSLNITSLTLDHVTKGNGMGMNDPKKPYGSAFKWNLSRSQFELKKFQEPGEQSIQLGLFHRKHNEGMLLKPFGFKIDFIRDGSKLSKVLFTSCEVPANTVIGETGSLVNRIVELLTDVGQLPAMEISKRLKEDYNTVKARLNEKKELFKNYGKEGWGVLYNGD